MNGRNPLPSSMKKGKQLLDPEPLDEVPTCPDGLDDYAREAWNEMAELLVQEKMLTRFDLEMLKHYAQISSLLKRFETYFSMHETELFDNNGSAILRKNPYVEQYLNIGKQLEKVAEHFGMSPKARGKTGFKSSQADKNTDKFNSFMNGEIKDEDIGLD